MKKVCVITSNRADFGLLQWLMKNIEEADSIDLQIIATGGHFSSQQDFSWKEIERCGFVINQKVEVPNSLDTSESIGLEMGNILAGVTSALSKLGPDLVIVLGDRYEILAAASAALVLNIPIAHLHGGEITSGAIDDSIRHAITKLSNFHFVSADSYRNRVIQMGEDPDTVFSVGAFGLDSINKLELLTEREIRSELGVSADKKYLVVTWHPETKELEQTTKHFSALVKALANLEEIFIIFTRPNKDPMGITINSLLDTFYNSLSTNSENFVIVDTLGTLKYLSALKFAAAVVGNSSSGIIEAPVFRTPTLNIGNRQRGRLRADTIIDCPADEESIQNALQNILNQPSITTSDKHILPYGNGEAADHTIKILSTLFDKQLINANKTFFDVRIDN